MKKLFVFIIAMLMISIQPQAQTKLVSEKFIECLNNYQGKELSKIITADFKIVRTFSNEVTGRAAFLGSYMKDSKSLIAKYKIVERPAGKDKNYYVVLDQSQYLKLLDVKFPTWKMKIATIKGKISRVTLEPTADYDAYQEELESKTATFNVWMSENYPNIPSSNLSEMRVILNFLHTYLELKNVGIWELQKYDDGKSAEATTLSDAEIKKMDEGAQCNNSFKYSDVKRRTFYPFNKAKKVLLISFIDSTATAEYYSKYNKITEMSIAKTSVELTPDAIDLLTKIIYNIGFKQESLIKTVSEVDPCPALKNAIVFVDEAGKPFEYIELFFGCDQVELSSKQVTIGERCSNKMYLLKTFFNIKEIEVGK